MALYRVMLANAFKAKAAFRFDYIVGTVFAFCTIVLKVSIWKGLYGSSGTSVNGIFLSDMVAYSILSSLTQSVTRSHVMTDLNEMVLNGNISIQLLLPLHFRKHLLLTSLTDNLFGLVYSTLPPLLISILLYGLPLSLTPLSFFAYLLSLALGFVINFLYSFLLGLSVLWLRNAFFLRNLNALLPQLFSGTLVPMWFFPGWLNLAGAFLPFRFMVFEPLSILLGKNNGEEILLVLLFQLLWIAVLFLLGEWVWRKGQKKLMVQGG